jgi:Fur family transcriptional regulator, ferric uptake regulator
MSVPRNTRQRQVMLDELRKLKTHPTAAELYDLAKRKLPRLSLGTVYRNLELLSRAGTVLKLDMSGREARFDGNADPHMHVRCMVCGRVHDVFDVPMESFVGEYKTLHGYEIVGFRMEFIGVCPECRGSTKSKSNKSPGKERDRFSER